jgi:hypothetical protein
MRCVASVIFAIGLIWISFKEIHYSEHRYFSDWSVFAKKLPQGEQVDRNQAVELLRALNVKAHTLHKSYQCPILMIVGSAFYFIVRSRRSG